MLLGVRQNWSEERAFFLDGEGVQHSLPVGWTDAAGVDVFVAVAAGRCALRVADLLELALLVDGLADGEAHPVCKVNYAATVGWIMPNWQW